MIAYKGIYIKKNRSTYFDNENCRYVKNIFKLKGIAPFFIFEIPQNILL